MLSNKEKQVFNCLSSHIEDTIQINNSSLNNLKRVKDSQNCIILDVVFGSLATLLAAIFTYLLRKQNRFLASLPPIVFNALIVPYVLKYGYGLPFTIGFMTLTVAIGEIISCGILGQILLAALNKRKDSIFVD